MQNNVTFGTRLKQEWYVFCPPFLVKALLLERISNTQIFAAERWSTIHIRVPSSSRRRSAMYSWQVSHHLRWVFCKLHTLRSCGRMFSVIYRKEVRIFSSFVFHSWRTKTHITCTNSTIFYDLYFWSSVSGRQSGRGNGNSFNTKRAWSRKIGTSVIGCISHCRNVVMKRAWESHSHSIIIVQLVLK